MREQRGAGYHAVRQRGCVKVLQEILYRARTYTKASTKRSWLLRGKTTGMRESPGRNLVDTTSSSAYAESLLASCVSSFQLVSSMLKEIKGLV
jgi:hypothetical protein